MRFLNLNKSEFKPIQIVGNESGLFIVFNSEDGGIKFELNNIIATSIDYQMDDRSPLIDLSGNDLITSLPRNFAEFTIKLKVPYNGFSLIHSSKPINIDIFEGINLKEIFKIANKQIDNR